MSDQLNLTSRKPWILASSWILIIYASLPVVRPLCEFLKLRTPFSFLINSLLTAFFLFIMFRNRKVILGRPQSLLMVVALAMLTSAFLYFLKLPEERIHLAEYGILGVLLWKAVHREFPGVGGYVLAFILGALVGWGDEIIQDILPDRYFQISDISLNAMGVVLGLALAFALGENRAN